MENLSEDELRLTERRIKIETELREIRKSADGLIQELEAINEELKNFLIPGSYILDKEVDWSAMPDRIWNRLKWFRFDDDTVIETYRDLISCSSDDLIRGTRGVAATSISIIEEHLYSLGLSLAPYRGRKRHKNETGSDNLPDSDS